MRRVKVLFGVLVALMAVGLATSAAAFAEPELLPERSLTATSGAGKFLSKNGLEVKCSSDEAEASPEPLHPPLYHFDILFLGCKGTLSTTCTGLKDESNPGSILVLGLLHFYHRLGGGYLAVFLIEEVHFSCSGILSVVRGCAAGTTTSAKSLTGEVVLKQTKGVNEITDFMRGEPEESVTCILETSTSGGKFEQSGEETTEAVTFTGGEAELMG